MQSLFSSIMASLDTHRETTAPISKFGFSCMNQLFVPFHHHKKDWRTVPPPLTHSTRYAVVPFTKHNAFPCFFHFSLLHAGFLPYAPAGTTRDDTHCRWPRFTALFFEHAMLHTNHLSTLTYNIFFFRVIIIHNFLNRTRYTRRFSIIIVRLFGFGRTRDSSYTPIRRTFERIRYQTAITFFFTYMFWLLCFQLFK